MLGVEDAAVMEKLMEYPVSAVCRGRRVGHLRDLYGDKQWKIEGRQFQEIEVWVDSGQREGGGCLVRWKTWIK